MDTDEELYHATPQTRGKIAHETIDYKTASNQSCDLQSLPIISDEYIIIGKIDIYRGKCQKLIERKYQIKHIYQGQVYQLWAQYLCMIEMEYDVKEIAFYEISTNKMIPVEIPNQTQLVEFRAFLNTFRSYDPSRPININKNKCLHCVYCSICDKMDEENVYQ